MSEVWFRWATLIVPQMVALAALYQYRIPIKKLNEELASLNKSLMSHLTEHIDGRTDGTKDPD